MRFKYIRSDYQYHAIVCVSQLYALIRNVIIDPMDTQYKGEKLALINFFYMLCVLCD